MALYYSMPPPISNFGLIRILFLLSNVEFTHVES